MHQSSFHRSKKKRKSWSIWALADGSYHCGSHSATPDRFHLLVVWRGSNGLGKIREFIRAPFPPGPGASPVPLRERSASTRGSPHAFDPHNLTITHWEICLRSERLLWSRVASRPSAKLMAAPLRQPVLEEALIRCFRNATPRRARRGIPVPNPKSRSGGLAVSSHSTPVQFFSNNLARHLLQTIEVKIKTQLW